MLFSFCCCSNNKKDTKKSEKDENFIVVFVRKGPKRGRQRVGGWQHKKKANNYRTFFSSVIKDLFRATMVIALTKK